LAVGVNIVQAPLAVMKAAGAAAEVQVAADTQAHPAAVDFRAAARNTVGAVRSTAGAGNLENICGPTDPDAFRADTLHNWPT
jgi:hypothetical protein